MPIGDAAAVQIKLSALRISEYIQPAQVNAFAAWLAQPENFPGDELTAELMVGMIPVFMESFCDLTTPEGPSRRPETYRLKWYSEDFMRSPAEYENDPINTDWLMSNLYVGKAAKQGIWLCQTIAAKMQSQVSPDSSDLPTVSSYILYN
jgi:hypothetical protein